MEWVIIASVIALGIIVRLIWKFGFLRTILCFVIGLPLGSTIGGFIGYFIGINIPSEGAGFVITTLFGTSWGIGIGAPIGLSLMLRLTRDKSAHSEKMKNDGKSKRETFTPTMWKNGRQSAE